MQCANKLKQWYVTSNVHRKFIEREHEQYTFDVYFLGYTYSALLYSTYLHGNKTCSWILKTSQTRKGLMKIGTSGSLRQPALRATRWEFMPANYTRLCSYPSYSYNERVFVLSWLNIHDIWTKFNWFNIDGSAWELIKVSETLSES